VARLLRDAGARVEVTYSPGPDRCRAVVEEAVAQGHVVVAVGGDGMVASLAGTIVESGGLLGIIPSGRGNDFARQLGLSADPDEAAATLLKAEPGVVDVIDVAGRVVVGSVYAGVDSRASELVNHAHGLPGSLQYPYATLRALATYKPASYRVEVDGAVHEHRAATVVVANSGYYGKGMHIAPVADPRDGLLDVIVIGAASRWQLVRSLPKLYDGSHLELDEVTVLRGRSVSIAAAERVMAYGDGELLAPLPVTATVRPGALQVVAGVDSVAMKWLGTGP
jgi:diacylglycerol kinase (ATP)